ncbi:MAG TPA: LapA family protein [Candidatus Binatia bacterium]|nr:LapA family protein [Candidatus Binatia bacterium]
MYLRTLLIIVVLLALAIFAALNWGAITTQTTLSLGFAGVEAPLGLILLGFSGVLTLLFLVYLVYLQSSALVESRRYARELQAQRDIAENTEASRFKQLQSFLETELRRWNEQSAALNASVLTRLDGLDREMRGAIEQSGNSLAAYIGEIEDRLERMAGGKHESS